MSHALNLEDHKAYRRMEQQKEMYLYFYEMFVKQRKLWVDTNKSIVYVVEQYNERKKRNVGTLINNGPLAGIHV